MANPEHLMALSRGTSFWSEWRRKNPDAQPDLSGANLSGWQLNGAFLFNSDLRSADLSRAWLRSAQLNDADLRSCNLDHAFLDHALLFKANLTGASLKGTDLGGVNWSCANLERLDLRGHILNGSSLQKAKLHSADLSGTQLIGANLSGADLSESNLTRARLDGANLDGCDLRGACLVGAILRGTALIGADLSDADLTGSFVYGVSAWDLKINSATKQYDLAITPDSAPVITVDNIKVAQFIYLLLNNQEIRDVIDTIAKKAVLILGRFSEERKPVLDAIRDELRKPEHNYVPIVFDFQTSANQTTIETIKTLANMSRFVIADLTDARSVLQELQAIVPNLPSVAVRLLINKSAHEYGMLDYIRRYKSVVENTYQYENLEEVIASIKDNVIGPAETKVKELRQKSGTI